METAEVVDLGLGDSFSAIRELRESVFFGFVGALYRVRLGQKCKRIIWGDEWLEVALFENERGIKTPGIVRAWTGTDMRYEKTGWRPTTEDLFADDWIDYPIT